MEGFCLGVFSHSVYNVHTNTVNTTKFSQANARHDNNYVPDLLGVTKRHKERSTVHIMVASR